MTKRNPYLQHTYGSSDQPVPPRRPTPQQIDETMTERFMNSPIVQKMRSPVFATVALLATGVAFAAIIIASYPASEQAEENLPVVSADAGPLRMVPDEAGGMEIANQDSTVLSSVRSDGLQETPPIENLLAQEQPVDTQSVFPPQPDATVAEVTPPAEEQATQPSALAEAVEEASAIKSDAVAEVSKADVPPVTVAETRSIPMKSEKIAPMAGIGDVASALDTAKEKAVSEDRPEIAPAASTPETLAYVRSVLDKKEKEAGASLIVAKKAPPSAEKLAAVEPASGAAIGAGSAIKPGTYFAQLASISSESAAAKEWTKLQKAFPSLSGAQYRVQRADLGAKGVFYRIQAGPMSKDSAKGVCDAVKAQKPGGCIITQ
ncbi:MAG: SPOR domain-containing protein [Alphaproteobacteria bacterium]